jgi:antirestriction protein
VDLEELERARQATRESRLHQYDQLMRSWVSEVASMDKQSARVANDARKEMLADLRSRQDESIESLVKDFCRAVSKEWSSEQKQVLQSKLLNSVQDL